MNFYGKLSLTVLLYFICPGGYGQSPLTGKRICLDPGHGGSAATDHYRVGANGEREEWINLRVAKLLQELLEKKGATVFLTRNTDSSVELSPRAQLAVNNQADAFISIHHNATADRSVNFPIIYFHGAASENLAGVRMGTLLAAAFRKYFYRTNTDVSLVSDYTIFPSKGAAVLRESYGIPGLLAEASFFTNETEEEKLKSEKHNKDEANAYFHALESFFSRPVPPVKELKIPLQLPVVPVLEEADRMKPEALNWYADFEEGKRLMNSRDTASLRKASVLFGRSARSFPDSYVARRDHLFNSQVLRKLHEVGKSEEELTRVREFYPLKISKN